MIKKLIGKLTLPKDAVKYRGGNIYVPCNGIPKCDVHYSWTPRLSFGNKYQYRKIEQNWYGRWVEVDSYLGTFEAIKE